MPHLTEEMSSVVVPVPEAVCRWIAVTSTRETEETSCLRMHSGAMMTSTFKRARREREASTNRRTMTTEATGHTFSWVLTDLGDSIPCHLTVMTLITTVADPATVEMVLGQIDQTIEKE